jgi:hypothetical protein
MRRGFAMNQTTVHDIQIQLSQYLSNAFTLEEFRNWFDDQTWGLAAEPDSAGRRIAGEIELRIAEFTSGHLTEAQLRNVLIPLAPGTVASHIEIMDFQIPVTEPEPVLTTF